MAAVDELADETRELLVAATADPAAGPILEREGDNTDPGVGDEGVGIAEEGRSASSFAFFSEARKSSTSAKFC